MKFVYIDESGNTGWNLKDAHQPFHFLSALSVDETHIMGVQNAIKNIGSEYFSEEYLKENFEFHGVELRKGTGYFKEISIEQRVEIAHKLMSILKEYEVDVFLIGIDKDKYYANVHPHQAAFVLLVERLNPFLIDEGQRGLLICDENHDIEQPIINDLSKFQEYSTSFGYKAVKVTEIVDSVHFVKSHNNPIIQLADIVAYFANRRKLVLRKYGESWNDADVKNKVGKGECVDLDLYDVIRGSLLRSKIFP